MKTVLASLALMVVAASAFTVVPLTSSRTAALFSSNEPEETSEGELDLDLEEMFTMFDAAAKGEDFDKAIKKVKKDE